MRVHSFGFTLLELIVVIAIVGIILSIAIPEWNHHVQMENLQDSTKLFVSDLQRAEAKARQLEVSGTITSAQSNQIFKNFPHSIVAINALTGQVLFSQEIPDNITMNFTPTTIFPCSGSVVLQFPAEGNNGVAVPGGIGLSANGGVYVSPNGFPNLCGPIGLFNGGAGGGGNGAVNLENQTSIQITSTYGYQVPVMLTLQSGSVILGSLQIAVGGGGP